MDEQAREAIGPLNATINLMMNPISEMDLIRLEPVVWIDSHDLDEIHADAEEATSLDAEVEPGEADEVALPDD